MEFQQLDRLLGEMVARAELSGETCGLKHSEADPAENHLAVDFLCQDLGDQKTGGIKQELRIPICAECAEALLDPNWILCYCVFCQCSQWIYRPYAKTKHPEGNGIYFMDVCPFCAEVINEWREGEV